MRILHVVTNADLAGAPRVVTELANRAVAAGYKCGAASAQMGPFWDYLDSRVEQFHVRHLRRNLDPIADSLALLELISILRNWRPDIVHVHSSKAGILGRLAAWFTSRRIVTVYTVHGFDAIAVVHPEFLFLERLMVRQTTVIVPVSEYDETLLHKNGIRPTRRTKVELIRNGVTDRLNMLCDPEIANRLKAARHRGDMVVLSIARLEPQKRFDLFVEVARRFSQDLNLPRVAFFWIGNVQRVDPAQLPANVEMLGEVPEAGNCINSCDIFLLLSAYEGLPMSILEALSCGKPVVASDVGGNGEAVGTDGKAGVLVSNDVDMVVAVLSRLALDPNLRAAMGQAARRRYEAGFSADDMWRNYLNLYQNLYEEQHGVI